MRPGVRSKLFLVSLLLILLVGGSTAVWLESNLRAFLEARVESRLVEDAETAKVALLRHDEREAQVDWLDALAQTTHVRLTLITHDGTVLGDSEVGPDGLEDLDDHSSRPEVLAARNGMGMARRFSTTVGADMLYVALGFGWEQDVPPNLRGGFVRAAVPLSSVDAVIHQLRVLLSFAALLGLGLAIAMSLLASHLLTRALRRLVDHARVLMSGQGHRIDIFTTDEIGRLAGSFNRLAEELETTMGTLAVERGQFGAILDSMSEAVLVMDERQDILLVNPETSRLLHLEQTPLGRPLGDCNVPTELTDLAVRGATGRAQSEFTVPGPRPRVVLGRATPLRERGGTVIVLHDVTEVRRLENIRKDFVANVSHELRTPVSIVQANAETLLEGALEDPIRARTFVEALHRNAERLSRIIADLLDLSRLESGRYHFELYSVELLDLVEGAVEGIEAKAHEREQSIEISVSEAAQVTADPKALEQVLINLLENAIKYAPPGGQISVRSEELGSRVRIEVQDDGPGIKAEHRTRIFERFYRIDAGRSRDMGGTGLGLAIVKHFVESMGGEVGVEAAFPRGSVFWITLPIDFEAQDSPPPRSLSSPVLVP